jgi:signal transduction histidine kinase
MQALVDNAVKFTPQGGHVQVRSQADGNGMVLIDVLDEGIGIPANAVPRIFDRFYQVDSSVTRRYSGSGMGLALVERLAKAHGARVDVESTEGKGSRFSLHWPAQAVASAGEAREVAEERGEV